jgi:hypothetical protein
MYSSCLLIKFHNLSVYLISGTLALNLIISRDGKVKLTKCQNHHHHGGVFDTWTEWAKPQAERAQRSADRPNSLAGHPCFMLVWPVASRTRVYTSCRRPRWWRSQWRPLHPTGRPCGLADRLPLGAKLTSPSRWSSPMAL